MSPKYVPPPMPQLDPAHQRYICTECGSGCSRPARTLDPRYVLAHCPACHKQRLCKVDSTSST